MSVPTEDLIAINGLLIEREGAFARVSDIEQSINQLLGDDYPFAAPEHVPPSRQKRKVVKGKKSSKAKKQTAPKIRRLLSGEHAYRLTWSEHGNTHTSTATDVRSIESLIKQPLQGMRLLKVETLDLDSAVLECIYERAPSDS
ncbi:hypothetical protein [Coraliomargarita akajimensis]|uniref:Uncharacterized protein n=1 Tax=Coraliomargarita akajimensis (strain DSM 45221 / IAM 15411 / JCM 23193 / KCTC 12865 / 04OKA010-24) TaxID=583355 RepID=D5EMW1_CORAD|nr:hypothetical protein [Coraliomargarita akajimensis]ADE55351.1 hypothetical protein Caka_2334 [Coraliomargarita akajimensis DSM 45221]